MSPANQSVKLKLEAQRRRALAPAYDPIRRDFDLGLAQEMEKEAQVLLTPSETLQTGLGGEIIPPAEVGLPGLESALKQPDLLDLEASVQRSDLIERAGVLELGIETAKDNRAVGSVQKMISHQMAAAHKRAMSLMAESQTTKDADIACKKARTAAKMMDAFSRAALTLQRLQSGASQVVQVQHVQVNGPAVIGMGGTRKMKHKPMHQARQALAVHPKCGAKCRTGEPCKNPSMKNGRCRMHGGKSTGAPIKHGQRTKAAIEQEKADNRLLDNLKKWI